MTSRTLIDLTQSLDSNVLVYPGDPPFSIQQACTVPRDGYSVHALSCSSHVGTHVDAPSHFVTNGATIDQLPLSTFILPAFVIDVSYKKSRECITWDAIEPVADRIRPGIAVLFQTGWSRYWDNVAERLVALGVRSPDQSPVVGPSAETEDEGVSDFGAHMAILGAGRLIDAAIPDAEVIVSVLPLKVAGCDASPVRAVAWLQPRGFFS
ncbi:hypothetical protein B0F90DRAFT_1809788 [Multifurca ochricompacta]|uniref:Cyclase n=1 Tax=Multifurca ochricompacta TaxID=376703 RepID=A0AAD4QMW2_9AGAM|nr:hypothetical protein B0F90DRAFT_1809788 [Multifurca ochricompacta]